MSAALKLPLAPLLRCTNPGVQDPFCTLEFRIESLRGRVLERGRTRVPGLGERLVRRCTKCLREG